jgi:hypothetical protein
MYGHPQQGYQLGTPLLVDYLDGDGWQPVPRDRALRILREFYPAETLLEVMLEEGAVLPIHFGGFEARFASSAAVKAAAERAAPAAADGLRRAA